MLKYQVTFDYYPGDIIESDVVFYKPGHRVILMSTENTNTREMWYWVTDDNGKGFPLFNTNIYRYHGFAGSFNQYAYHIHGSRYVKRCERRKDELNRTYLHITLGPDTRKGEP